MTYVHQDGYSGCIFVTVGHGDMYKYDGFHGCCFNQNTEDVT